MQRVKDPVFALVAFYDLLDYPLTSVETWRLLKVMGENHSLAQIRQQLESNNRLECSQGFFTLKGRECLADQRMRRYLETELQLKKSWPWLRLIASFPGIKAIFLCNNFGLSNPSPRSDIDLFIITDPNLIWTARWWATSLLRLGRRRPRELHEAGSICLSFFASETALSLERLKQTPDDIYMALWKHWLVPLYDPGNISKKISRENNALNRPLSHRRTLLPIDILEEILSRIKIEDAGRLLQWRIFPQKIKKQANLTTHVIVNNELLKFHTNDDRDAYRANWQSKLSAAQGAEKA